MGHVRISEKLNFQNLQNTVWMYPYSVLGAKRCFGNGICTKKIPKTTPLWWWPLLLSQVSQCTRMKEIVSRVSSRIREMRWLPSVPTMTRTHTTAIVHLDIDTATTKMKSQVYNPGVCTPKFNDKLLDILIIQRSGVVIFFSFVYFVSSRTLSHMTPNIYFSRPIEINSETCENCYCAFLCSFSSCGFLTTHTYYPPPYAVAK